MRTLRAAFAIALAAGCSGELVPMGPGDDDDGPDGSTPEETTMFRPSIQQDLDFLGCITASCHGSDLVPMPLTANPLTEAEWEGNYTQVKARAGTSATSLLIDKATGAGGHTAPLDVGHPMFDRWQDWIDVGAPYQTNTGGPDAGPTGGDGGPPIDAGAIPLSWNNDIRPLMVSAGCTPCHGSDGAYSVETYSGALGFGTDDVPNVIPGDALSLLAVYCEQGHFDMPFEDTLTVISWIVDFDAQEL